MPFDCYQNQRPWMTLNGRTVLHYDTNDAHFGAHHGNLKEDRLYFRTDIRGGSVARGSQTTVGWSEPAIFFCNFAVSSERLELKPVS